MEAVLGFFNFIIDIILLCCWDTINYIRKKSFRQKVITSQKLRECQQKLKYRGSDLSFSFCANNVLLPKINHLCSIKKKKGCHLASHTIWCCTGPSGKSFTSRGSGPRTYLMSAPCTLLLSSCGGWKSVAHQTPRGLPRPLWPWSKWCLTLLSR